jgi:hypothetical protein
MSSSRLLLPVVALFVAGTLDARGPDRLVCRPLPAASPDKALKAGERLATGPNEQRRVRLPDRSLVYVRQGTTLSLSKAGVLDVQSGEVFIETSTDRAKGALKVKAPGRDIEARDGRFGVRAGKGGSSVIVAAGSVKVDGIVGAIVGGQVLAEKADRPERAERVSHLVSWTRQMRNAAPLVPASEHAGGTLTAKDAEGQEAKLDLRRYHIDVHVEDGFARTTIDQTYFNRSLDRMEGTFRIPLPQDASLCRLAMYVDGNLMEGGMAERDHARATYERIVYQQRDPALLEWVDGSTFKMRVFPLEPRQEKRIILSYTQRLPVLYEETGYCFPMGGAGEVGEWSLRVRVKGGKGTAWSCNQQARSRDSGDDLVIEALKKKTRLEGDVVLSLTEKKPQAVRFSTMKHEGANYLLVRYRPDLVAPKGAQRRDWVVLVETSGDRDPLLARAQIELVRSLLLNSSREDSFVVLTASTRTKALKPKAVTNSPVAVEEGMAELEKAHIIGAFDMGAALRAAKPYLEAGKSPHLLHVGSGIPAMGERRPQELLKLLPKGTRYVGVGVGRRWERSLMKHLAEKTSGYFTRANPDEPADWRGLEIASALDTPRLLGVSVSDPSGKAKFLPFNNMASQGEEVAVVARFEGGLPEKVRVSGTLDGKEFSRDLEVKDVRSEAGYLPRAWAQLEIDRLLNEDAAKHRKAIVELSKAMYVMTPFTSLLVLESEDMYKQFKVDRGRKDHWAMYDAPAKVKVVTEPLDGDEGDITKGIKPSRRAVLKTFAGVETSGEQARREDVLDFFQKREMPALSSRGITGTSASGNVTMGGYSGPNRRVLELINQSEDLRQIELEVERFWMKDQPSHLTPDRVRGGVGPSTGGGISEQSVIYRKRFLTEADFNRTTTGLLPSSRSLQRLLDATPMSEAETAIRRKLLSPVTLNFEDTPLKQVIDDLRDYNGINIVPDLPAIRRAGISLDTPITIKLNNVSLNSALTLVLHQARLAHQIRGEVLLITTEDEARGRSALAVPPVAEFLSGHFSAIKPLATGGVAGRVFGGYDGEHSDRITSYMGAMGHLARVQPEARVAEIGDAHAFFDLLAYAPGLHNSRADALAALDAEARPDPSSRKGRIDPKAKALLDAARKPAWRTYSVPAVGLAPAFSINFDGAGRYVWKRTLASGFEESVICDGKGLWHVYPELGLAARRTVSRHHHNAFAARLPFAVPSAEDIAYGADLVLVDATTVALVPHGAKKAKKHLELRFVFDEGRLAERQLVEMPARKTIGRETFAKDGTWSVLDRDGKEVASLKGKLSEGKAPLLRPALGKLVILDMPIRTPEHTRKALGVEKKSNEQLTFAQATKVLASLVASGEGGTALNVFQAALAQKDQRQIGYYVLLASAGVNLDSDNVNVLDDHPHEPLAHYLSLHSSPTLRKHASRWAAASNVFGDGALRRLGLGHALLQRWSSGKALGTTPAQRSAERSRALAYARKYKGTSLAWVLLALMQDRAAEEKEAGQRKKAYLELAKAYEAFPGGLARYERARCLWRGGDADEARKQFTALHGEALKAGGLLRVDADFRAALLGAKEGNWATLMRQTAAVLVKEKKRAGVLALAQQAHALDDLVLARHLLATALKGLPVKGKEGLALYGAAALWLQKAGQFDEADRLVGLLLKDEGHAKLAGLWRVAADLADSRERPARALQCRERTLALEFEARPEVIDVQQVRRDYEALLESYDALAHSLATLKQPPPPGFRDKVIRAADRWRALGDDQNGPCVLAARALRKLGERELAFDYQVTPAGINPGEADVWALLAEGLARQGDREWADRAFASAFERESTNAQYLWDRAENLRKAGRLAAAKALYRQLANTDWQPRFSGLKEQAKWALEARD